MFSPLNLKTERVTKKRIKPKCLFSSHFTLRVFLRKPIDFFPTSGESTLEAFDRLDRNATPRPLFSVSNVARISRSQLSAIPGLYSRNGSSSSPTFAHSPRVHSPRKATRVFASISKFYPRLFKSHARILFSKVPLKEGH